MSTTTALVIGLRPESHGALEELAQSCELVHAGSAEDALTLLRARRFQAIFVDESSPDLSPSALDYLRAVAPTTPKAVLGVSAPADRLASLLEGYAFEYLPLNRPDGVFTSAARRLLKPRAAERLALAGRGLRARGRLGVRTFEYRLLDVSATGLAFAVPIEESIEDFVAGTPVSELGIVGPDASLLLSHPAGSIRRCGVEHAPEGTHLRVGVTFEPVPMQRRPHARTLSEPLPVLASFRKAIRADARITVTEPDGARGHAFARAELELGPPASLLLLDGPETPFEPHDVARIAFDLHGQSYTGVASVVSTDGGLRLALPRSLRVHHRRGSHRHEPTEERPKTARLRASLTGLDGEFAVLDLNATGFSVLVDDERDLIPPGLVLEEVEFSLGGGRVVQARGVVRAIAKTPRTPGDGVGSPARCGIELTGLTREARHELLRALVADAHPNIDVAGPDRLPEIWETFRASGHRFHLYADGTPQSHATVRHAFSRVLGSGRSISSNLVYVHDGVVRGHIQGLRTYSRTWLATHLASLQGDAREIERVSRALCRVLVEHIENQPDAEYLKFIWKKDQRATNRLFGWSGRAVQQHGLAEPREFGLYMRAAQPLPDGPLPFEVREALDVELPLVERYFAEHTSVLRVRSEDLTTRGLRLEPLARHYGEAGLERGRSVRLAIANGRPVAFSLCETSTKAVQINEFLNHFSTFVLPDADPDLGAAAREALVRDGVRFSAARGLAWAVGLGGADEAPAFEAAGFRLAATLRSWTLHRSILRTFADAWDVLSRRHRELFGDTLEP